MIHKTKIVLLFISPNGTTKKTAEELKKRMISDDHEVELLDIGLKPYRENDALVLEVLKSADIVGIGSPVYHMGMLDRIDRILLKMSETQTQTQANLYKFKAFIFVNYAGITSGKALLNTAKILHQMNIPIIGALKLVAPHFHHVEKYPKDEAIQMIATFCEKIKAANFPEMEWNRVQKLFSPDKIRVRMLYPFVHVIGKKRELPITIRSEKCKKCQKCINECPCGAIRLTDAGQLGDTGQSSGEIRIDLERCMHCYHCVVACPFKAIESPIEKLDSMIRLNKKIIGIENPQNTFYV